MVPLQCVLGFLFCVSSFAQEHLILDQSQLGDVIDELKLLRKEVEENRKHIQKQEAELKAVKLELEETKRHCLCGTNSAEEEETSESEIIKNFSQGTHGVIQRDRQSRIRRIIPPTSHEGPIAFYAYMSTSMDNVGGHHTLIFDVIKTNSGLGLHPTSGVFIAPQSGLYVFTWTIRVYNTGYHSVELVVNGQGVGALYQHSVPGEDDTGSTTAVVHVNDGEDVFLRTKMDFNQGVIDTSVHGYSSFAGWKLG